MLTDAALSSQRAIGGLGGLPVGGRLGFWDSVRAGAQLAGTSWRVVAREPWVLAVSFVQLLGGGVFAAGYVKAAGGVPSDRVTAALVLAPLVVILSVLGTVGSAVIVHGAAASLDGADARPSAAWAAALRRLPDLVALGALFAVQRIITSALRSNRLGRILADLLDRAWDFATYLAVPVIVFEGQGPLRAIRRSGELVVSRWGAKLTAQSVIGVFLFVCALPLYLLAILVAVKVSIVVGVVMGVVTLLGAVTLSSALDGVLSAAMYRFVTTGLVSSGFTEGDLRSVLSRRD